MSLAIFWHITLDSLCITLPSFERSLPVAEPGFFGGTSQGKKASTRFARGPWAVAHAKWDVSKILSQKSIEKITNFEQSYYIWYVLMKILQFVPKIWKSSRIFRSTLAQNMTTRKYAFLWGSGDGSSESSEFIKISDEKSSETWNSLEKFIRFALSFIFRT